MQIFQVSELMESITQSISEGNEPDQAALNLLLSEGPKAIEEWVDSMDNIQAEVDALDKRIKELTTRKKARAQAVERMDGALKDFLKRHFDGKVKLTELTAYIRKTPKYEFEGYGQEYLKCPEPVVDKAGLIAAYKAGTLPSTVNVTVDHTESLIISR